MRLPDTAIEAARDAVEREIEGRMTLGRAEHRSIALAALTAFCESMEMKIEHREKPWDLEWKAEPRTQQYRLCSAWRPVEGEDPNER